MAARNGGLQTFAALAAAMCSRHVGRCPGLIDEDEAVTIELARLVGIDPVGLAISALLAQAVEMEAEAFSAGMKHLKLPDGRDRLVRDGHGPVRTIQTGIGAVEVARVNIRDRAVARDGERIRFTSAILPLWARRTKSLDALLPVLYLRGISTGDFQEALATLLGKDAPNYFSGGRFQTDDGVAERLQHWQKRDLSARRYVYVWADGVFLQARMEDHSTCMLVLIGETAEGKKELIGF
ncbi:transposase-like protein [Bradyrhizobium sp. USDA 4472]